MQQTQSQNGKGSKPRPVNKKKYNENWDLINWNPKPKRSSKEVK